MESKNKRDKGIKMEWVISLNLVLSALATRSGLLAIAEAIKEKR